MSLKGIAKLWIGAIVLWSVIGLVSCVGEDDYDYDDEPVYNNSYDNNGEEEFDKAVKQLQEEIDQEEMYGDEISDLDNQ